MAYNPGSQVKIVGVSKPGLNDQIATVLSETTGSNGMPRYVIRLLNSGEQVSLAPKNLIPIAGNEDSGGGMPGMPGMPANLAGLMEALPPWLKEKLARGEKPDLNDLKRLIGIDVSTTEIGIFVVTFLLLFYKLGIFKALIVTAFICFIYFGAGRSYSSAGGGVTGVKATFTALTGKVSSIIRSRLGYELTSTQASLVLGGMAVAVVALVAQSLLAQSPAAYSQQSSFMDDDEDLYQSPSTSSSSFASKLQDAYDQGYIDGGLGSDKKTMSYTQPPPRPKQFYSHSPPPGPPPSSSNFGISQIFNIGYLLKNVYDLGGRPFNLASIPANFSMMGTMQKVFMGFMVLRIFGMSPL